MYQFITVRLNGRWLTTSKPALVGLKDLAFRATYLDLQSAGFIPLW